MLRSYTYCHELLVSVIFIFSWEVIWMWVNIKNAGDCRWTGQICTLTSLDIQSELYSFANCMHISLFFFGSQSWWPQLFQQDGCLLDFVGLMFSIEFSTVEAMKILNDFHLFGIWRQWLILQQVRSDPEKVNASYCWVCTLRKDTHIHVYIYISYIYIDTHVHKYSYQYSCMIFII